MSAAEEALGRLGRRPPAKTVPRRPAPGRRRPGRPGRTRSMCRRPRGPAPRPPRPTCGGAPDGGAKAPVSWRRTGSTGWRTIRRVGPTSGRSRRATPRSRRGAVPGRASVRKGRRGKDRPWRFTIAKLDEKARRRRAERCQPRLFGECGKSAQISGVTTAGWSRPRCGAPERRKPPIRVELPDFRRTSTASGTPRGAHAPVG